MDGYGGMNCETECADTELSIKCADGLQYKCCDKSITVCDTTGACCPTGLNRELKCNSGYTCDDKTSRYEMSSAMVPVPDILAM
jgi:hypothetical protein